MIGMGATLAHAPWAVRLTKPGVYNPHASWVIQWYTHSMGHRLYNSISTSWVIDCIAAWKPHGPWVVWQHGYSMGHEPYKGSGRLYAPWVMDHMVISYLSWQYLGLYLSPTTSTLPLPSVSSIGVLLADQYTYLIALDLPTILAFSLLSTLLPVDPLLLLGSTTPVYHRLAYVPPSTGFYHPSILSYNDCGHY